jgi:hypothetical protein
MSNIFRFIRLSFWEGRKDCLPASALRKVRRKCQLCILAPSQRPGSLITHRRETIIGIAPPGIADATEGYFSSPGEALQGF